MSKIILVGMMGSGKSTVGKLLAEYLDLPFEDTDVMLQRRLGRSIPQIFQMYGEDAFRQHENSVLQCIDDSDGILATGGGIVVRDDNWDEFKRIGMTVWLDVNDTVLKDRLDKSLKRRPLLEYEDWEIRLDNLLNARRPLYAKADFRVEVTEDGFDNVVRQIVEKLAP
ncbi:MAG: shikimate kinase [Armatimonadetes bacterium]|nr:shikimate kinase [Armatimonadota bacterium]